jgi:hypothetical protein
MFGTAQLRGQGIVTAAGTGASPVAHGVGLELTLPTRPVRRCREVARFVARPL